MEVKQEDLIKFWLHFGFKSVHGRYYGLTYPDGKYQVIPQLTLDNLYQFAIPKLQKEGEDVILSSLNNGKFKVNFNQRDILVIANTPTEALYNAVMKVIENEVKREIPKK